jgi:glycosyltransferase involved in cell wall biosynthesis
MSENVMDLIQASAWYPPDSSGGVEVYLDGLTQDLKQLGFNCKVAAARPGEQREVYDHNGTEVFRYPVISESASPHAGFEYFARWLQANRGDIYHQHTLRDRCGLDHLRFAKQIGMKTVVTIHMPETTCLRKTMMRYGDQPCDGKIDMTRCSRCLGVPKQAPSAMLEFLGRVPQWISKPLHNSYGTALGIDEWRRSPSIRLRQLATTLSTPAELQVYQANLQELVSLSDRIVVVCQWLYDAFAINGVPAEKLFLSRHGVNPSPRLPIQTIARPLTIGFMGRWQETKGVQTLVEALQQIPEVSVNLILHATHADQHGSANRDRVLAIAERDPRIQVKPALGREEVAGAIASFDLLAVPSQWLETGPLVVLEAFAAGTPVIGSKLGGIAELVEHGVDGWLLPAKDVNAWAGAIQHFSEHPEEVKKLRENIRPVRTTREVAEEMAQLYRSLREQ